MSSKTVSPYKVLVAQQLSLMPVGQVTLRGDGSIDIQEIEDHFDLKLSCELDLTMAEELISPSEDLTTSCSLFVVGESIGGRSREVLETLVPSSYQELDIRFTKSEHRGEMAVTALLVRQRPNAAPRDGCSGIVGAILGKSQPVRVHFDEPSTAPGSAIESEWAHFATDPRTPNQDNHIFAIDRTVVPPKILLNSDVQRLPDVLNSVANRGRKAAIRDAMFTTIVHQVWTSLIASALSAAGKIRAEFERDGEPTDADSVLAQMGDWDSKLLQAWAKDLFSESDQELAEEILVERLGEGIESLIATELPAALQRTKDTPRTFNMLVSELGDGS